MARIAIVLIVAAFVVALAARGISAWECGAAGPQEVRYISIAQGLLGGRGFEGIDKRFPDIIQPPLHELMLAVAIAVVGDPLLAGRSLTVLLGALLVFPAGLLAWRMYGPRTAWRAAWLVAVYPLLIHFSGIALTEPVFGLLVAVAVVFLQGVVSGRSPGLRGSALAGVALGLGFLDRPEGLAYLLAAALFLFLTAWLPLRRGIGTAALWSAALAGAFLAFAIPYSVWLHTRTGHWRVSPKAVLTQVHNMIMTEGIKEHWPEKEGTSVFYERVKFGLNADATDLRSSEAFRALGLLPSNGAPTEKVSLIGDVIQPTFLVRVVLRNFRILYLDTLKYGLVLPTLFMGLLALGIASEPWRAGPDRRSRLLLAWFLLAGCSWALSYVQGRFLYASIGLAVVWIARGWVRLEEWMHGSFMQSPRLNSPATRAAATVLLSVIFSATSLAHAVPPVKVTRNLWHDNRIAGKELRKIAPEGSPVMALTPIVSFYADLPFEMLPYADVQDVLKYAHHQGVRYLAVHVATFQIQRPQLEVLTHPEQAPAGLKEILHTGDPGHERFIVYELSDAAGAPREDATPAE